jgi:hypothetical protein
MNLREEITKEAKKNASREIGLLLTSPDLLKDVEELKKKLLKKKTAVEVCFERSKTNH